MVHRPAWFRDDAVMVSTAPTCGLTKGGRLLPLVDRTTGQRVQEPDPLTGELVDAIDDQLKVDMEALRAGDETATLRYVDAVDVSMRSAVPTFYDRRFDEQFDAAMDSETYAGFSSMTIGDMIDAELLTVRAGHGSPSASVRVGTVPYIKVSDLRAGLVNINPTNRVPTAIAHAFWRGPDSGLSAWDLLCPSRTSKNIGDFCMLMPGQERVVITKEVLVVRPGPKANFDPFYLMWALTLTIVRDQWRRVIFMQTNREDVGERYRGIRIPIPGDESHGVEASAAFRDYYQGLAGARGDLQRYLTDHPDHHFFMGNADEGGAAIEDVEEDEAFESPGPAEG